MGGKEEMDGKGMDGKEDVIGLNGWMDPVSDGHGWLEFWLAGGVVKSVSVHPFPSPFCCLYIPSNYD